MLYTKHKSVTTTDVSTLWETPAGFMAVVQYVFVANHGGSTNQVNLWYETLGGSVLVQIYNSVSLGSGSQLTIGNGGGPLFVVHNGECFKASTVSAGDVDFAVTFEMVERPTSLVNFV